ncbi:2-hydroxyglutaryl-CoA dehydratase D-component [Desulfofarcimen acetoxidans DSM 771]|uniref:2-hydroxyglutaryl-CoA dehydratase D-component n=1 Tax=Desulfofarcimen acetoxidans (strain ATCC 49208 / DSM 771 / KCTC 5769 / VKM B-1644 / 5575) TaxID=485916 RepID=C8W1W9_DESAS|nr:double-cubane-cluster-containing anaerobic reductase [Desulfofarcimen acetoxidans]ACV63590.1 2-hydroxyglutaryl-CoA dehydratase D-component [Desulfofarcimen acetoxidans DSM 771]
MLSLSYLNEVEKQVILSTKEQKAKGTKVVGVYCAFTPRELIAAAGGIPVSLCGSSNKPIPAAEQHLPKNLCPLIKSSYGFAITNTCPYFDLADILIADATCDGKKKMFELLSRIKPVHLLQLPQTSASKSAFEYWLSELYLLKDLLEEKLECKITNEKLFETIRLYNKARQLKNSLFQLNKKGQTLLTGREINIAIDSWGLEIDLSSHITRLLRVIEYALIRGGTEPKPRILLTGCPTTCKKVLNIIEEAATVVVMENCGGMKTLVDSVDESGDPMTALAKYYLNIACPCMTPNQRRYDILSKLIEEYMVDGVIDLTWQACHTYNIESYPLGRFIQNLGIPYLQLETDYSESDENWIRVRVEAFVEMF